MPCIGVTAPVDVGLGKIGVGLPVLFLNQRQDTRAVAARLGAEDAIGGALLRLVLGQALADPVTQFLQIMLAYEVLFGWLIKRNDGIDGIIDQIDQLRKSIAEKTADAGRHVNARTLQLRQRNHFNARHLSVAGTPDWLYAEQTENLRDVVAMGAHGAGAPDANGNAFRIGPGLAQMTLQYPARQLLPDPPGRLREIGRAS